MDMENERLEEGTAGEVVTPGAEGTQSTAAKAEGEQGSGAAEESGDAGRSTEKAEQTHEERVRYKAARQQGEKTGYERAAREVNARIAGAGLTDPITGKPITTLEEFEDYGKRFRQQRIETRAREEKKTVAQVEEEEAAMELLRRTRREDGEKAERLRKEQEKMDWLRQDLADFREAYPNVDLLALEKDRRFVKFCGGRLGSVPAAELYADYLEVTESAAAAAADKKQDKQERGTGSGGSGSAGTMTAEERKGLEEWNSLYPDMKMSEKEWMKFRQ